jgi:hypothetical protein
MNARVSKAVDVLLDLHEDINSRMQNLLAAFPAYSEQAIRNMAQADPTAKKAGNYITWICKMYKEGKWAKSSSTAQPSRDDRRLDIAIPDPDIFELNSILSGFDTRKVLAVFAKKNDKFFPRPGMCRDIMNYKTPEEVEAAVKRSIVIELTPEELAEATAGTKVICGGVLKDKDLILLEITSFQAARVSAKGTGDFVPPDINHGLLLQHAGTGDPGWPWAGWCTSVLKLYEYYSPPLYVVKKGENPYIQVWFGKGNGDGQAMDIHDKSINIDQAVEIAPLFNAPEFDRYMTPITVDVDALLKAISSKTQTNIRYRLKGGQLKYDRVTREPVKDPETGKQMVYPANCKTNQECYDKTLNDSENLRQWSLNIISTWGTPLPVKNDNDPSYRVNKVRNDILDAILVKPNVAFQGVGALILAKLKLMPGGGIVIPNELAVPELFRQRYAKMLLNQSWEREFGEKPRMPDIPAPAA